MSDLMPALPELWVAAASLVLLLIGTFRGDRGTGLVSWLSIAVLIIAAVLVVSGPQDKTVTFGGMFIVDAFGVFAKVLALLGSSLAIIMSLGYLRNEGMARFEFPILIVLATLGMMMMISANDMMSLYLGLELQSLALYVVAAFKRDSVRATEAGLKYFVLGALSSGMLLYGISLIYGFTGSTNFVQLAETLRSTDVAHSVGLIVGLVFLVSGLAFKVSAVPFHMWTPDVYEGAATPVTAFLAAAPKIAAMALFLRTLVAPFMEAFAQWQQIIVVIAIASMALGAFAALRQDNLKRLMAYSSIGHMGYALMGLAAGTSQGLQGVLVYLALYLVMNVGTFAAILTMRVRGTMVEGVNDLAGLGKSNPMMAFALAILMFSLAGIPPMAGFFGKFYVFLAAVDAKLYVMAVAGVLSSVVAAYYYLRIIKVMYFDDPAESFEQPMPGEMRAILAVSGAFTLLFVLYPAPLLAWARIAAGALLP
ncbi:MAG: NADH-quinone oxidoreductase subunit NuoN [Alphaproteobacteria bacterium]|nr:NADH-quinone oxidoreductase subunit NuoN [Alphaproteobacteria bacterium]